MIKTGVKLPNVEIDKDNDFYFFPYFITEVQDINFNSIVREKILTGRDSVILKPVGIEYKIEKSDADDYAGLIRTHRLNNYSFFQGKLTNLNFSTKVKTLTLYTKINVETSISAIFVDTFEKSMIWNFQTKTIKKDFVNFFFFVPELNEHDFLFITSVKVNIDPRNGNYISHFVNFASLADLLNQTGRTVSQKIQLSAPGENFLMPKVTYQNDTKKISYEQIKRQGIKYLQIEPENMFAWSSIRIWGRRKTKDFNKINDPTRLFIANFYEQKPTSWAKTQNYELKFSSVKIVPTINSWFNSWKKEDAKDIIFPDDRRKNYGNFEIKTRNDFHVLGSEMNLDINVNQILFNSRVENVTDNLSYKKISPANAMNLNSEILSPMNIIEFGNSIFKNSKAKTRYWIGTTVALGLGAVGGLMFGKAGAIAGGLIGKFVSPLDNLLPSNIFNQTVYKKYPNEINAWFPTEILDMLTTQYSINGDENSNIILPFDIFESTNSLKTIVDTQSFVTTLLFSLTDEVQLGNTIIKTLDFYKNQSRYISPKWIPKVNSETFVIDKIEIKGVGKTKFRITGFDDNLRPVFFLNTQNQALYSDDIREWTTEYSFNSDKLDESTNWNNYTSFLMEDSSNWANPILPPASTPKDSPPTPEETLQEIQYFENNNEIVLDTVSTKIQPEINTTKQKLIDNLFNKAIIEIISEYSGIIPKFQHVFTKEDWLTSQSISLVFQDTTNYLVKEEVGGRIGWQWKLKEDTRTVTLTFVVDDNANATVIQSVVGGGRALDKRTLRIKLVK